jgi:hypothetical protein
MARKAEGPLRTKVNVVVLAPGRVFRLLVSVGDGNKQVAKRTKTFGVPDDIDSDIVTFLKMGGYPEAAGDERAAGLCFVGVHLPEIRPFGPRTKGAAATCAFRGPGSTAFDSFSAA